MSRVQRAYRQLSQAEAPEPLSAPAYSLTLGSKEDGVMNYEL